MGCQLDKCFICQELVLGLRGQDDSFDTALLEPNDKAISEQAYGSCHIPCLVQSRWGFHWAKAVLRHLERSPQVARLYDDGNHIAVANTQTKDIRVIRSDGKSWNIRRREFSNLRRIKNYWQLPIEEEFNFELRGMETLIHEVQERLSLAAELPLMELLIRMGVEKRYSPPALESGRLVLKQELKRYWTATGISVWASYAEMVPDQIHAVWEHCATALGCHPNN